MTNKFIKLLRCLKCGENLLEQEELFLYCRFCTAKYSVKNGVPIMYDQQLPPNDLQYQIKYAHLSDPQSSFRRLLRSMNIETLIKLFYTTYSAVSSLTQPGNPASPAYWMEKMQSTLPPSPKVVLDLGGGKGQYKRYLASENDLYLILEVDYDNYVVQKNINYNQYVIGDGHTLIFADNSFDVISMFEVLEHVRNPFQIFANCARWLKPGGLLVLSAPQYWHVHGWPRDYFRYTIYGLKELADTNGLKVFDYWALGGPCVLIWCVVELNFSFIMRLPIIKQFLSNPLLLISRLGDWLLFRNNLDRTNPDTRGWMAIFKKPC